jgi:hypothetical protein
MTQYHSALQSWEPGAEIISLGHLYMGMEAMTPVALRAYLTTNGLSRDQVVADWGIELKQLDSEVRRRLLFDGDSKTFENARTASDGFEHGHLPFQTIREHAISTKVATARLLRKAILSYLGFAHAEVEELLASPFDKPMSLRVHKYIFGKLTGALDNLAEPNQIYPILRWESTPTEMITSQDGLVKLQFNEQITARLGPGVTFQAKQFRVYGGPGVPFPEQ